MGSHGQSKLRERSGRDLFQDSEWQRVGASLGLTSRQLEIVRCMFDDHVENGIARELGISEHTVHTHVERLYRKLGVSSRCEMLVRLFAEYLLVCGRSDRKSGPVLEPSVVA